jgi:hypothetical protein
MKRSSTTPEGYRVIGIRHVLKKLKDRGQVERDTFYADEAADDIDRKLTKTALRWYKVGAVRGALVTLEEIRNGTIVLKSGSAKQLTTKLSKLPWPKKKLNVKIGKRIVPVSLKQFKIKIVDDLGFSK